MICDGKGIFPSTRSAADLSRSLKAKARAGTLRKPDGTRKFGRRQPSPKLDVFAELLSEHDLETSDRGGDVKACSERMGIKYTLGRHYLGKIRKRLGPQAV